MDYMDRLQSTAKEMNFAIVITPYCPSCQEYKELARVLAVSVPCSFILKDTAPEVDKSGFLTLICESCRPNVKDMVDNTVFWVSTGSARVAICG